MTDPVADLLTRIRNALSVRKDSVDVPLSKLKRGVAEVLKREGYINDIKTLDVEGKGFLRIYLKYGPEGEDIIVSIQKVSRPGRRVYQGCADLKPILRGIGISVVENSEVGGQTNGFAIMPKRLLSNVVKSTAEKFPRGNAGEGLDSTKHFVGRLVGEGKQKDLVRLHTTLGQQIGNAIG